MTPYLLTSLASFLLVFTKAWQQQNVINGHYLQAFFASYILAVCEVLVVVLGVIDLQYEAILPIGLGASFGVIASMYWHRKFNKKGD